MRQFHFTLVTFIFAGLEAQFLPSQRRIWDDTIEPLDVIRLQRRRESSPSHTILTLMLALDFAFAFKASARLSSPVFQRPRVEKVKNHKDLMPQGTSVVMNVRDADCDSDPISSSNTSSMDAAARALHERLLELGPECGICLSCEGAHKDRKCSWDSVEVYAVNTNVLEVTYIDSSLYVQRKYNDFKEVHEKLTQILEHQQDAVQHTIAKPSESEHIERSDGRSWLLGSSRLLSPLEFMQVFQKHSSRKWKQIQAFLRGIFAVGPSGVSFVGVRNGDLLAGDLRSWRGSEELVLVDYGCGAADLTFALHHVLSEGLGLPVQSVGIDRLGALIAKHMQCAQNLSWAMRFKEGQITGSVTTPRVDIAVALHACDTATDDALLEALVGGAQLIFVAPCCHQNLQKQMRQAVKRSSEQQTQTMRDATFSSSLALVGRDNLILQRIGDTLTDHFRITLLRMMGYRVDAHAFIDTSHSPKNLLIRAVRKRSSNGSVDEEYNESVEQTRREYLSLKSAWDVVPRLETLLLDKCSILKQDIAQGKDSVDISFCDRVEQAFVD